MCVCVCRCLCLRVHACFPSFSCVSAQSHLEPAVSHRVQTAELDLCAQPQQPLARRYATTITCVIQLTTAVLAPASVRDTHTHTDTTHAHTSTLKHPHTLTRKNQHTHAHAARKAAGSACGAADQCLSGYCSGDGYCCNSACNGACNQCSVRYLSVCVRVCVRVYVCVRV